MGGRKHGPAWQREGGGRRDGGSGQQSPPERPLSFLAGRAVPPFPRGLVVCLAAPAPPPGERESGARSCGSRAGKMPLAQLADPWQKMAVESAAESSTEVRAGGEAAAGRSSSEPAAPRGAG